MSVRVVCSGDGDGPRLWDVCLSGVVEVGIVFSGVGGDACICGDVAQVCTVVLAGSVVMTWLEGMR